MSEPGHDSRSSRSSTEDGVMIQAPGSIQAHGLLLAWAEPELTILQLSRNTKQYLHLDSKKLLGPALSRLLESTDLALLQDCIRKDLDRIEYLKVRFNFNSKTTLFHDYLHRTSQAPILELEPYSSDDESQSLKNTKTLEAVMTKQISLDALWDSATSQDRIFRLEDFTHLPEAARRYLEHAIVPGTKLASAVRLKMHGEIKLKRWIPFKSEQVICWDHGLIWSATAWMNGFLPIVGSDRIIDGIGAMQWKLLGLFPVMTASGLDITRSAVGRLQSESVCLPSVFCGDDVSWTSVDSSHLDSSLHSSFVVQGERAELDFTLDQTGRLKTFKLPRWGNPDGTEFHYVDFGGILEEEGTFCGYTIPTRLRIGWYVGTERFESEGEFFRTTIDDAIYR